MLALGLVLHDKTPKIMRAFSLLCYTDWWRVIS